MGGAYKNNKILYVPVEGVSMDMLWGLVELETRVESYPKVIPVCDYVADQLEDLISAVRSADIVMTQRFSVITAEACYQAGVPYASWIWDSPQRELFLEEAAYYTNRIFVFDRKQMERMKDHGIRNVMHEPLAVNMTRVSSLAITDQDVQRFKCPVSFVGNIRFNVNREKIIDAMSAKWKDELGGIFAERPGIWKEGDDISYPLPEMLIKEIYGYLDIKDRVDMSIPRDYLVQTMISDELSCRERLQMINAVAGHFEMAMFTGDGYECRERISDRVILNPRVTYEEEMPKVFNLSAININITKRSIETGVPLRVFDILGSGGFALTDSGEEVKELFAVGKELEVYSCFGEMVEKIGFYLKNDQLRKRIAINGYGRVKRDYTYPKALDRMLSRLEV